MDPEKINPFLETLTYLVSILGAPIAIWLFFREKRKERLDREYGTYNTLDDKYVEFLNLCLNYPKLTMHGQPDEALALSPEEMRQRDIIFEILVCLFERAFLMYSGQSDTIRKKQWIGWKEYMEYWMTNDHFRNAWSRFLNDQYDADFMRFMNTIQGAIATTKYGE